MNKNVRGFTIVELLIVTVVIAILAAITVIAYNGIQERARSIAIISRATSYVKGFKLWASDTGRPATSFCIAPSNYTTCDIISWGSGQTNDSAMNATLATYSGVKTPTLGQYGTDTPIGIMFYHENWYGGSRSVLGYRIGPNTDCGLSPLMASDHITYAPAGQNYTQRHASYTMCEVEVFKF